MDAKEINEGFRTRLRQAMQDGGWSQAGLSTAAGLNRFAVRDILKERAASPKLSTVLALCEALGRDPGEMIGLGSAVRVQERLAELLGQYSKEDQERLVSAIEAFQLAPAPAQEEEEPASGQQA